MVHCKPDISSLSYNDAAGVSGAVSPGDTGHRDCLQVIIISNTSSASTLALMFMVNMGKVRGIKGGESLGEGKPGVNNCRTLEHHLSIGIMSVTFRLQTEDADCRVLSVTGSEP